MNKPLLSQDWCVRLGQFNTLIVGFSGGLDSTVLLHVLAAHPNLRPRLIAVHVNHGLSANSSVWQSHCEHFCSHLGIRFISRSVQFDRSANREEGARRARYDVFSTFTAQNDCLILGHHMNDQAETVLLQLFRGSGIDGLAAMADFGSLGSGCLARPFLTHSRDDLERYATWNQLSWIEDESNQDISYSRNFLRNEIIPLLKKKWAGVERTLARTAVHCQQAKKNLDRLAVADYLAKDPWNEGSELNDNLYLNANTLCIEPLLTLSTECITNILRVWLKNNKVQLPSSVTFTRLIQEVIFASHDANPEVGWGEVLVRRYQKRLYIDQKRDERIILCNRPLRKPATEREERENTVRRTGVHTPVQQDSGTELTMQVSSEIALPKRSVEWSSFPSPLALGEQWYLSAKKENQGLVIPTGVILSVRFREGGEEFFWHGQTKRLKKLFQEWNVPPWLRDRIPLIYFNDRLAVVVGYAMSDLYFSQHSSEAWVFTENR